MLKILLFILAGTASMLAQNVPILSKEFATNVMVTFEKDKLKELQDGWILKHKEYRTIDVSVPRRYLPSERTAGLKDSEQSVETVIFKAESITTIIDKDTPQLMFGVLVFDSDEAASAWFEWSKMLMPVGLPTPIEGIGNEAGIFFQWAKPEAGGTIQVRAGRCFLSSPYVQLQDAIDVAKAFVEAIDETAKKAGTIR